MIFLDNHDIARFFSVVGENMDKYKSSLCWLLTCRGIPQLYYGSEIATTGFTSPSDGYVRQEFSRGWKNDTVNKFTIAGRTQKDHAFTMPGHTGQLQENFFGPYEGPIHAVLPGRWRICIFQV